MNQRVKDNTYYPSDEMSSIPKLLAKVSDKTLDDLGRENILIFPPDISGRRPNDDSPEDIDAKQHVVTRDKDGNYCFENVMGFLGYEDERLIIESRFRSGNEGNDYFFQYMLERVLRIPHVVDLNTSADDREGLFDYLAFFFPYFLKQAMRKGIFKTYIRRAYNDANIRGVIDVSRHIRDNTPFVGKIAYNQREHSYDNHITQLIRHTIEYIRGKSYGNNLLSTVRDEVETIVNATNEYSLSDRRKIIDKNKKSIVNHAYYHEYRNLQRLCIFILENRRISFGTGTSKVHGILFDGAWLWEEYVNTVLEKAGLDKLYHPKNKMSKGTEYLFYNGKGKIYPDFICRHLNKIAIADAKYKPLENIGGRDYQQVLAYMFRFDAKKGFYLYPSSEGEEERLWLNEGLSCENTVDKRLDIYVEKYGFKIPKDAENYDAFIGKMEKQEKSYVEKFNTPE